MALVGSGVLGHKQTNHFPVELQKGVTYKVHAIPSSPGVDFDLYVHIRNEQRETPIACVFVDEAQFLTASQVLQLTLVCDRIGIPVLCYGLRTDFRGEPFEGSKYLLSWADELQEIKTVCHTGKKAIMNARLDADGNRVKSGEQIEIGHNYIALSRKEFELPSISPIGYEIPDEIESQSG